MYGGAVHAVNNSNITCEENCIVTINNNKATDHGGALYISNYSAAIIQRNSTVTINSNKATYGGALFIIYNCYLKINVKEILR